MCVEIECSDDEDWIRGWKAGNQFVIDYKEELKWVRKGKAK